MITRWRWRTSVSVDPARIGQEEITRVPPECDEHEHCGVIRYWVQWDGAIHETHYADVNEKGYSWE